MEYEINKMEYKIKNKLLRIQNKIENEILQIQNKIEDKCKICNKNINDGMKGKLCSLRSYIDNKYSYHSGCVKCLICKKVMSSKKGGIRTYNERFWHLKCCKCICGCTDPTKFYLAADGEMIRHNKCEYNHNECLICNEVIGLRTCKDGYDVIHEECINTAKCCVCDESFNKNSDIIFKDDKGLRHEGCLTEPCPVCCKIIKYDENNEDETYHKKCCKKRFPECSNTLCYSEIIGPHTWFRDWTKQNHIYFPDEVKDEIKTILMIYKRKNNVFKILCKNVLMIIFTYIATVDGRTVVQYFNSLETCTPVRCKKDLICKMCNNVVDWVDKDVICIPKRCKLYSHECFSCKILVEHNSDPSLTCTRLRCIEDKIDLSNVDKKDVFICTGLCSHSYVVDFALGKHKIGCYLPGINSYNDQLLNKYTYIEYVCVEHGWYIESDVDSDIGTLVYNGLYGGDITLIIDLKSLRKFLQ